jgi:hypothetical protein
MSSRLKRSYDNSGVVDHSHENHVVWSLGFSKVRQTA